MTRGAREPADDLRDLRDLRDPRGSGAAPAGLGAPLACVLASGFAGLLYQTAWMRQLSVSFGTSELAVASVLAAFMAGLAGGSALAARLAPRIAHPLRVYALLELVIAAGALAVPRLVGAARAALVAVAGGAPDLAEGGLARSAVYLGVAFAVLLVPTAAMGATLPVLFLHAVRADEQVGRRVGALYAANTVGGVAGALAAAFLLLPRTGLSATVSIGAAANVGAALLALAASRGAPPRAPAARTEAKRAPRGRAALLLPAMLLSGAVSFTYEVLWTRLLGQVLGGSLYAFATMLASFLAGIALGSAVAARAARTRAGSALLLGAAQLATAAVCAALFLGLEHLPFAAVLSEHERVDLRARAALAVLVLFPAALSIGATYPLAVRALARDEEDAPAAGALVYAWNTAGAIAGAVAAGFFVLPALGFEGTVRAAVVANAALACACPLLVPRVPRAPGGRRERAAGVAVAVLALALALAFRPERPRAVLAATPLPGAPLEREVFDAVGRSATVLVGEVAGVFELRSNGLQESVAARRGAPLTPLDAQVWLGALPALARPAAREWLVVGLGGGVALEGVGPSARSIDVIELEPEVVAANRAIASARRYDPLSDPRVRVVAGDARGALDLTVRRWDVVASQPSHPWTAGASHLYTREFAALARAHLTEGGVLLQWVNGNFMSAEDLARQCATVRAELVHVQLFQPVPGMLLVLASDAPLDVAAGLAGADAEQRAHWARLGVRRAEHALALLLLDEAGVAELCAGVAPNTDDENRLATPRVDRVGRHLGTGALASLVAGRDPLARDPLPGGAERGTVAVALAVRGHGERALACAAAAPDPAARALAEARVLRALGRAAECDARLEAVLRREPDRQDALFLAVEPWLAAPESAAPAAARERAARLAGAGALAARAWRLAREGRFDEVLALEPELARAAAALPSDVCEAAALHAGALARVGAAAAEPERSAEHGRAALRLADELFALRPDENALALRLDAAAAAGDGPAALETARILAAAWEAAPGPAARARAARAADRLAAVAPAGDARAAAVLARLRALAGG